MKPGDVENVIIRSPRSAALTDRAFTILAYRSANMSPEQIARELRLSPESVRDTLALIRAFTVPDRSRLSLASVDGIAAQPERALMVEAFGLVILSGRSGDRCQCRLCRPMGGDDSEVHSGDGFGPVGG